MLTTKKHPSFLTRLTVRFFASLILLTGIGFFVVSMVQFAIGQGHFETLIHGILLSLSGFLLMRLRSRGVRVLVFSVILAYSQIFFGQTSDFWPQFYFALLLLSLLCLLGLSSFSLRRGEGRRPLKRTRFLVLLLTIILTGLGLAAYYDETFCIDRPILAFDPLRQPLHVSLMAPLAQWLYDVSCYDDGDLSFK